MSIKRYEVNGSSSVFENESGSLVDYQDYAALEAKCAALAAEVQTVKAMNDCLSEELRGYESDGAFEGPKMHLLWWKVQTPATDSFLAEVRASAIPADVMAAIQKVARIRLDLNDFDGDKRGIVDCLGEAEESLIEIVNKFAAQLRQEAAQ